MTATLEHVVFDQVARDVNVAVAAQLNAQRKAQGIKLNQLVDETGMSRAKLSRVFSGSAEIGLEDLVRLCGSLDLLPGTVMRQAWQTAHEHPAR